MAKEEEIVSSGVSKSKPRSESYCFPAQILAPNLLCVNTVGGSGATLSMFSTFVFLKHLFNCAYTL